MQTRDCFVSVTGTEICNEPDSDSDFLTFGNPLCRIEIKRKNYKNKKKTADIINVHFGP